MAKEILWKGKTPEEIKNLSLNEFADLIPARERRSIKRGFTDQQKIFLEKLRKGDKDPKTHCRDLIIIPEMLGKKIKVHSGKEFFMVVINEEKLGHRLGEFAVTRRRVAHSAPGIGATRSSAALSVR